jgi:ornithine cyclodeaminase/alanine dehydrogenase-like protein (mu-crystallin family)
VRPVERVTVWSRTGAHAATLAAEPLVHGRQLRAGNPLDLIGGLTPAMREADDDCFAGASIGVDTGEARVRSGDPLGLISRAMFTAPDGCGDLATLARGLAKGRTSAAVRTGFKTVGNALEDLAAAIVGFESG